MPDRRLSARLSACLLCLGLLTSPAAIAQTAPAERARDALGSYSLQVENDLVSGTDRHYTNGLRASWLSGEDQAPDWMVQAGSAIPFMANEGRNRWGLSLGHSLFTPSDTQRTTASPGDRPYTGWLYGGATLMSDTGNRLDTLELLVGMVGPSAHGETVQNDWHRLIGVETAKGWDAYQLHDEVGAVLTYERKWRAWSNADPDTDVGVDLTPHLGASLGTILTEASAGATLRLGQNMPHDYGPPRIRPGLSGTTFFVPQSGFGWYLFSGIAGRAVARNIFLDGNTFRDSPGVDKRPLVGDLQAGLAVTIDDWRIAYTQVWRSREFEGQDSADRFGSLSVSVRF